MMLIGYRPRGSLAALLVGWAAGWVLGFLALFAVWATVVPAGAGWEREWLVFAHERLAAWRGPLAFLVNPLGTAPVVAGLTVVLAAVWWIAGSAWKGALLVADAGLLWALNHFGKDFFARPRPALYPHPETDFAFPSGHALFAVGYYGFLVFLLAYGARRSVRRALWVVWFVVAVCLGGVRILLGAHWPTDVLAGYAAGLLVLL
ncbi:MAG: phosphatase PAP2 family protein, partial [Clostridia bacterium]|nr:phosphatase PAP2 family protein [Clostridia bacterium]